MTPGVGGKEVRKASWSCFLRHAQSELKIHFESFNIIRSINSDHASTSSPVNVVAVGPGFDHQFRSTNANRPVQRGMIRCMILEWLRRFVTTWRCVIGIQVSNASWIWPQIRSTRFKYQSLTYAWILMIWQLERGSQFTAGLAQGSCLWAPESSFLGRKASVQTPERGETINTCSE
jgi:hypothetical protein